MRFVNPYYVSDRVKAINAACTAFDLILKNNDDKQYFSPSQAFDACPELNALQPLNDGEYQYICQSLNLTRIE